LNALARWIGIPYVPRGTLPAGLDCWGLCRAVAWEEYHTLLPEYFYDVDRLLDEAEQRIGEAVRERAIGGAWQRVTQPRAGDIVVLRIAGRATHTGILVAADEMLHTLAGRASCLEALGSPAWRRRIEGIWRWS
jgi:cell wall-associated NlpC family hydrolase